MIDENKRKNQLTSELVQSKQQIVELKTAETKRKQVGQALLRSDHLFQALVENALDAIVIVGPDITIRYESPAMERMTGYKLKDRIGKNPMEFCHPYDTSNVADAFIQLLENKIPIVHTELCLRHKNGEWRTFELVGTNLIDDPTVAGIVLNLRDITERKRMEAELRRSEEKFRTLIDTMNDGLAIQDSDGVITFANDKLCEMLGCTSDELVGRPLIKILDEVNRKKYIDQIRKRREGKLDPYEIEFARKDGSKIITLVSPQLLYNEAGKPVGSFGVATDITERYNR